MTATWTQYGKAIVVTGCIVVTEAELNRYGLTIGTASSQAHLRRIVKSWQNAKHGTNNTKE